MKKLAIVSTLLGILLLGSSAGVVLADMSFAARSEGNHLAAEVHASSEGSIWLYDEDENKQSVVYDSLYGDWISTSYVDVGYIDVENDSEEDLWIRLLYEGPNCGEGDSPLNCKWFLKVKVVETGQVYYEGPIDYMGTGDPYFKLPAGETYTLNFEAKTTEEMTEEDETAIDFNMQFIGYPMEM